MVRGPIAGGFSIGAVVLALCFALAPAAQGRAIGAGKMTLGVTHQVSGQLITFTTQGRIKIKKVSEANCRKSRSVTYRATDPNGQPVQFLANLSRGNGSYLDRNTFPYDIDGVPGNEEVPIQGGTYTIQAFVPKQRDLKRRADKCRRLVSPVVTVTVPPFMTAVVAG